jgi:hypothetical protein
MILGGLKNRDALDANKLVAGRLLDFQAKLDRLFDPFHEEIKGLCLGVASTQGRH